MAREDRKKFAESRSAWIQNGSVVTSLPKSPLNERDVDEEDIDEWEYTPEIDEVEGELIIPFPDEWDEEADDRGQRRVDRAAGD